MSRIFKTPRIACLLFAWLSLAPANGAMISGYIGQIPSETAEARQLRHAKVAERRTGTILLAHRGASTIAPENTLEAYAAAMDYGADGCEVDVRRTTDDVLVMFHDDMLDRLTDGFGKVEDLAYTDLLALHPQLVFGTATSRTRPPTFAALLVLARQRAMLLHLDVKEPGLDDEVARMLDEADVWDHVVAVNTDTLPKLLANPKLKLIKYKGGVYDARRDVDPPTLNAALAKPGQMVILEDPRLAVSLLKRPSYAPVPFSRELYQDWRAMPSSSSLSTGMNLIPAEHLRVLRNRIDANSIEALVALLTAGDLNERRDPGETPESERRHSERIVERAWAAEQLGQIATRSKRVVESLELQVRHPGLALNWIINALDAHTSARALGRLHSTESAALLIEMFRRVNPDLARVRNPQWTNTPLSWVDWRKMSIIPVLGELKCEASRNFLKEYVALSEAEAREMSMPQFEEATKAFLQYRLTRTEILGLLNSVNSAVRGTAILDCVDHPMPDRTAALREASPWALSLPQARR